MNIDYELTKENILKKVSQMQIGSKFFSLKDSPERYQIKSPLRDDDKKASFFVTVSEDKNEFVWYDHGKGIGGDVFTLMSIVFNITNFVEVLEVINEEMELNLILSPFGNIGSDRVNANGGCRKIPLMSGLQKSKSHIHPIYRTWNVNERNYWKSYGSSIATLKKFNIRPLKEVYIELKWKLASSETYPLFSYTQTDRVDPSKTIHRIYRPFELKYSKFLGNATIEDIQGLEQLPEDDSVLVITKSLKDVAALYEKGIPAIAPHSETSGITKMDLNLLGERFNKILLLFDKDEAGKEGVKKIQERANYKIQELWIPPGLHLAKDISDVHRYYGETVMTNIINNLIRKNI